MNSQKENSNKALHHYGALRAPRVNADVGTTMKTWTTRFRSSKYRRIAFSLASFAFITSVGLARGEILPQWTPAGLTRLSDLVVIGRIGTHSSLQVTEVIKGYTSESELVVNGLDEFSNGCPLSPPDQRIDLGRDAILFLNQREQPPRVVGNGFYRVGMLDGTSGVLGYWQPMNPGGYSIKPEVQFKNLAEVKALVQAEIKAIPARHNAAFDKVKNAKTNDEFRQALHELENITRIGDVSVLKRVVALEEDGTTRRLGNIYYFIQNVHDPKGAPLLQALYEKHPDVRMLEALGRLGNPESIIYLQSLIDNKRVPEPIFALYGMKDLYLALEAKGDTESCGIVRDLIYRYVDNDLMGLMMSAPRLISVIPDQRSLERLQRAYVYHANRKSNAEYEIAMCIEECKAKIASQKTSMPNKGVQAIGDKSPQPDP